MVGKKTNEARAQKLWGIAKMMKGALLAFLAIAAANTMAADAPPIKGGLCYGTPQALYCEHLGKVTVKEIYDKGWSVVAYVKEGPNTVTVVIEERR